MAAFIVLGTNLMPRIDRAGGGFKLLAPELFFLILAHSVYKM
jgi:hypothetical protein